MKIDNILLLEDLKF